MKLKGLSLMSGGLDSQLAIRILEDAGAEVEAVTFVTPFFDNTKARTAAAALGVKLHEIDFLDDELQLVRNPPHGFGGAMNPCIDCHAMMIRRAGELMSTLGYGFVATGEVLGQRPMSQNAQSLATVEKTSGLKGRLIRPLSAKLLAPTIPETEGLIEREKLFDISGRARTRQIELAAHYGLTDYPSPAGGCKLTEKSYGRRLKDLLDHEGASRTLIDLLALGRRFRLADGSSLILGRDANENTRLAAVAATLGETARLVTPPDDLPGPTALIPDVKSEADLSAAHGIVRAWSRGTDESDRAVYKTFQLT